jgi:diacylglycerol kinase
MKTFKHAITGIINVIRRERNFRIHLAAAVLVIPAGLYFSLEANEWLVITLTIAIVFALEMINSALEYLCDHVSPAYNKTVKSVKDAAAGAVLITAIGALVIAGIIFIPKIIELIK